MSEYKPDYSFSFQKEIISNIEAALLLIGANPEHFNFDRDGRKYNINSLPEYAYIYTDPSMKDFEKKTLRINEIIKNWFPTKDGLSEAHIFAYLNKALVNKIPISDVLLTQLEAAFLSHSKYDPTLISNYAAIANKFNMQPEVKLSKVIEKTPESILTLIGALSELYTKVKYSSIQMNKTRIIEDLLNAFPEIPGLKQRTLEENLKKGLDSFQQAKQKSNNL